MIWLGISVMNAPALTEPIVNGSKSSFVTLAIATVWSCRNTILAFISPAFLWLFFLGQAKGDITSGVEESLKRYGADAKFQEYRNSVPLLVPDLRRIFDEK